MIYTYFIYIIKRKQVYIVFSLFKDTISTPYLYIANVHYKMFVTSTKVKWV